MANLHFESGEELAAALAAIERRVAEHPPTELDLRLHWRKHLLLPEYHRLVVEVMKRLVAEHNGLPLYSFLPECFEDKLGITCFPHCDRCALFEAGWCKWPKQFTDKYYRTPQKSLGSLALERLTESDFSGELPVTWFTPAARDFCLFARVFSRVGRVVDFGCGSGFVSSLLLREGCTAAIEGVDPFAAPSLSSPRFSYRKELSGQREPWALLSSLGDYHVPVEKCFEEPVLPAVAAFIVFPAVFGRGGERVTVRVQGGMVRETERKPLFSLGSLEAKGYELALHRPVRSSFYADCELRIYVRDRSLLPLLRETEPLKFFPWEKASSLPAMSTESFA